MRRRDSEQSKKDILAAAEKEFSLKGFYGARIDEVAKQAGINKRMLYEYFGNKEELYAAVLETVCRRLCESELKVLSESDEPMQMLKKMIGFYFVYLNENPSYVNLLLWENLNRGEAIQKLDYEHLRGPALEKLQEMLYQGVKQGVFRSDLDLEQTVFSLLTVPFSYFSNRFTLSRLFSQKLDSKENLKKRIAEVTRMFLNDLCPKTESNIK